MLRDDNNDDDNDNNDDENDNNDDDEEDGWRVMRSGRCRGQLGAPSLAHFPLSAMFNTSATKLNSSATKFKLTLTTPKFNNAPIHCPVQQTLCTLQSQEVCYKLHW